MYGAVRFPVVIARVKRALISSRGATPIVTVLLMSRSPQLSTAFQKSVKSCSSDLKEYGNSFLPR